MSKPGAAELPPLYVDPHEPPSLREIGVSSSLIEDQWGVDFLQATPHGGAGIQRKEFPGDFLSSITSGRLAKALPKMARLKFPLLLLEGVPRWTSSGRLQSAIPAESRMTRSAFNAILLSIQFVHNVPVLWSANLEETRSVILAFFAWACKAEHMGLSRRPGPGLVDGKQSKEDWQLHFLQGLPDVGPKLARNILKHYGGVPMMLAPDADKGQLSAVEGIGPGIAAKIEGMFKCD